MMERSEISLDSTFTRDPLDSKFIIVLVYFTHELEFIIIIIFLLDTHGLELLICNGVIPYKFRYRKSYPLCIFRWNLIDSLD